MTLHFTLNSSSDLYKIEDNETVLQAALKQGLVLPYGCKNGACGSCKATIIDGEVDYGEHHPKALSVSEQKNKKVLLCTAKALTNLKIRATLISRPGMINPKK